MLAELLWNPHVLSTASDVHACDRAIDARSGAVKMARLSVVTCYRLQNGCMACRRYMHVHSIRFSRATLTGLCRLDSCIYKLPLLVAGLREGNAAGTQGAQASAQAYSGTEGPGVARGRSYGL